MSNNIVRFRVVIRGTRPLLQHAFGPDAIPLEDKEKTGKAGNDPEEWKKTCMITPEGQLFLKAENVFSCIRDGARFTKSGRGSLQPRVAATLQIDEEFVLLNRYMPKKGEPTKDKTADVYIDVCGVRNPSTKARNVRYRLAASKGWECRFTLLWDKTIVAREQMRAILNDAGILVGIGDGRSVGKGRFEVVKFKELVDAEEETAGGSVEDSPKDRLGKRWQTVQAMRNGAEAD